MSIRNLHALLAPRSIVVVGASDRPGSVGATVWRNVLGGSFRGERLAVNPAHRELAGQRVYPDCASLPMVPDLALVCTPPDTVPAIVAQLAALGVRAAVVMTAGLSAAQRQAMLDAARPTLMRLLGPNCLGLLVPGIGLNASFAQADAPVGPLAFVSQSGAITTAVIDGVGTRGVGFSCLVSLGDHADVDFGDLLDYLGSDPATRAILLYAESVTSPRKFMSAARAAARNKPVIVVKAGRAGAGVHAAASHTGAMAGSDAVVDAALRRAGLLRVDTLQQLFDAAETLARFDGCTDVGLTIVSNGGGAGVMAADAAASLGVPVPPLRAGASAALDAVLPATWSHGNPVDLIGDAPATRYAGALRLLLADRTVGPVLFIHAPTAIVAPDHIAEACLPVVRDHAKRMLACWLGGDSMAAARRCFDGAGIADYRTPEQAVEAFAMRAAFQRNQALLSRVPSLLDATRSRPEPDLPRARAVVAAALAQGRTMLDETEAKALLSAFGVPVVTTLSAGPTPESAEAAARQLDAPRLALKIRSPDLPHKSDVGGVVLDLAGPEAVRDAAAQMLEWLGRERPRARLDGFSVQPCVNPRHAREVIVGASVDPMFGPVILFGQGGTAVEVVADRAIALPPLDRTLARDVIDRTRVARLLAAYRDVPAADRDAVVDALLAVSRLLAELPEVAELDINPLLVHPLGAVALDARVRLDAARPAGAANFAIRPYPEALVRTVDWEGAPLLVRPIRPDDEPQHRRFLHAVSREDLRLRFFDTRADLPESELARLVQVDYDRETALVAERPSGRDGTLAETLGVARAVCDPDREEAEFAVLVRSDLHGRGLGTLLMHQLMDALRADCVARIVGDVLPQNAGMRRLMAALGFEAVGPSGPGEVVRYRRDL